MSANSKHDRGEVSEVPLSGEPPLELPRPTLEGRGSGKQPFVRSTGLGALVTKVALLGILDAFAVTAIIAMVGLRMWVGIVVVVLGTGVINWIYLGKGKHLPAKYLAPGTVFLLVFQVFVIVYSGYIAFTNYSDGHSGTKDDAIAAILVAGEKRVEDSPAYPVEVIEGPGGLGLLATAPSGTLLFGTADKPVAEVSSIPDGYRVLQFADLLQRQGEVIDLRVPLSDDEEDGALRTSDGSIAYQYRSQMEFDEAAGTLIDTDGSVYRDGGNGAFVSDEGTSLTPGWKINVGFRNFENAFTNPQLVTPLLRVLAWTIAFALISVLVTFAVGLSLALLLQDPRVRARKFYRIVLILPYAFPVFLSALVWAGLMNPKFGFINQVLLGGASVPWLTDPWLARFSVILVNLWLGYPYMFLVSMGALQSLPADVEEAAKVDGAGAWTIFRRIKLPLLLVSLSPLLIASFAFNFNNFNLVYMLTKGAPRFTDTTFDVGATDLLITMVYKIAFGMGGGRDYALASALSIIIFILVATVAVLVFRRTKALEEVYE